MTTTDKVAGIVLAAGLSERFGSENKLLQAIDGLSIIRRTINLATEAGIGEIVVVTGHDADAVEADIADTAVTIVRNATPKAGMGTSLAAGANAVRSLPDAVIVMLGDMPFLSADTIGKITAAHAPGEGRDIVVPVHDGRRGHPVLFGAKYMPQLCALTGDTGARAILRNYPERVRAINVDDPGALRDIDTPEDLAPTE